MSTLSEIFLAVNSSVKAKTLDPDPLINATLAPAVRKLFLKSAMAGIFFNATFSRTLKKFLKAAS